MRPGVGVGGTSPHGNIPARLRVEARIPHREPERLDFEGLFGVGEFIAFTGYPYVHGRKEEDAHD